jgi:Ca2+-binding RTX toxin-like protein
MRRVTLMLAAMVLAMLVASGVALAVTKTGGPGDDVLRGTNQRDTLEGGGGDDVLIGLAARDFMAGGTGKDTLEGGRGNDVVLGGPPPQGPNRPPEQERPGASDTVKGGRGADVVDGAAGADALFGGPGGDFISDGENRRGATDTLDGGPGDDFFWPRNEPAGMDIVLCESGRDRVFADRADIISDDCERVFFRNPRPSDF